jgi:hypothetical protein
MRLQGEARIGEKWLLGQSQNGEKTASGTVFSPVGSRLGDGVSGLRRRKRKRFLESVSFPARASVFC